MIGTLALRVCKYHRCTLSNITVSYRPWKRSAICARARSIDISTTCLYHRCAYAESECAHSPPRNAAVSAFGKAEGA